MKYDCVVIGAGIAGITAALFLKRANKKVVLIEKGTPGGTINTTSSVKNYPTIVDISGPDFATKLYEQVVENKIDIIFDTVIDIKVENNVKKVFLPKQVLETNYIVIATGKENRKLNIPLEKELTGHGVSYCALCDGSFFKGKKVAVVGTGNSALEEALYLSNICSKVTILAKYDYFKSQQSVIEEVKEKENIDIKYQSIVQELLSDDGKLTGLIYKKNDNLETLKISGLFIYIGSTPNIFTNVDLELDNNYIVVNDKMETNISGIYAIGDVIKKDLYQLVTAASEGALAATNIIKEMNKR